jgi:D-sedoheptulose 7-phosphate isomerase
MNNRNEHIKSYLAQLKSVLDSVDIRQIEDVIQAFETAYLNDRTIFICGNGGSIATAAHWVCDFSKGTISAGKRRLRMFSLGDNMSMLTAYANDESYEHIFSGPIKTYVREGDVVVIISASGNSPNVLEAARAAVDVNAVTVGLIGFGGGKLAKMVDHPIVVQCGEYGPVEDLHIILDHIISSYIRKFIESVSL